MKQIRVICNIFYDFNSVQYLVSTICGLQGVRYGAVLLTAGVHGANQEVACVRLVKVLPQQHPR
jgi:hypothetical protein